MEGNIAKLYPQFFQATDREKQTQSVNTACNPIESKQPPKIDPKLKNDIHKIENTFASFTQGKDIFVSQVNKYDSVSKKKINPVLEGALCAVPSARRILYVEENAENNNPVKAVGLGFLGLINLKEDFRDLMSILGRSKTEAPKGYFSKFKFFAGTPIEKWLEKSKWGQELYDNLDVTLADTRFGYKIESFFNIQSDVQRYTKETRFPFFKPEIINREYVKHNGKFVGKLVCLTMNRITKVGFLFMSLLEIPRIYKAIRKENNYSQIPKSAVNVISCTVCGALGSALSSLITGLPAGSVIGLGLGIFIGNKLSDMICGKDK